MTFLQPDNKNQYHKPTFAKIPTAKQERILDAAIKEFASNGYNATSINVIAKKADISIGSMYSYFESKENLFMTLLDIGYHYLNQALEEVIAMEGSLFDRLRKMISVSIEYSQKYHEVNQIYIDLSTEGLSHLSRHMSLKMESSTAAVYHNLIDQGKKEGIFRKEMDTAVASFCIDNVIMMTQFSFASDYYKERMKIYAGNDNVLNTEVLADKILDFLKNGLSSTIQ